MSELSSDARDLVAQARKQGSELLGPSAEQRAQLREKLAPLWAAEVVQPRAAGGLRWKLGSLAFVLGLGVLGWHYVQSSPSLPLPAAGVMLPLSPASDQRSQATSATSADHAAAAPAMNGIAAPSTNARGVEPCAQGFSLRAGVCAPDAPPAQPLTAAATRKAKRAVGSVSEAPSAASRKSGPPPSAAVLPNLPANDAPPAATANESKESEEQDQLAGLGLGLEGDGSAEKGGGAQRRVPAGKATAERLPLKAAAERTAERAVQTDADPGPPSIDGELELLGAAQVALQKQRPSRALTLLQEHAFRFPTGAMVEERMAMQALALCALQRRHAAQTVLSNLEARGPQSQLLPRVRSQCGL